MCIMCLMQSTWKVVDQTKLQSAVEMMLRILLWSLTTVMTCIRSRVSE